MGVIDFDVGTASIDAMLVDSRLAHKFALTGAMAMRARWTSGPGAGFVLAVGGLNPHFAPPETLPVLQRVSIALASGDSRGFRRRRLLRDPRDDAVPSSAPASPRMAFWHSIDSDIAATC